MLGQRISLPVMLDPAGDHAAAHPDAELATDRAAGILWFRQYLKSAIYLYLGGVPGEIPGVRDCPLTLAGISARVGTS